MVSEGPQEKGQREFTRQGLERVHKSQREFTRVIEGLYPKWAQKKLKNHNAFTSAPEGSQGPKRVSEGPNWSQSRRGSTQKKFKKGK